MYIKSKIHLSSYTFVKIEDMLTEFSDLVVF